MFGLGILLGLLESQEIFLDLIFGVKVLPRGPIPFC